MEIKGGATPSTKSEINQQIRQNLKSQTEVASPLRALAEELAEESKEGEGLAPAERKALENFFNESLVAKHDMK